MDTMIIGIAGGTGSGKTTLTEKLKAEFGEDVSVLYHDNYYKSHSEMPYEERTRLNYDHPDAFETDLMIRDQPGLGKEGRWSSPMDTMIIGIAGGTGSGKTTLTEKLKAEFGEDVSVLYHDNYYKSHSEMPYEERTRLNYDHPDAFETDLMIRDIQALRRGETVRCPVYDYTIHDRSGETVEVRPTKVIIIEGILIFENQALRDLMDIKIFVDADADVRILRRIMRDVKKRGRSLDSVVNQYLTTVKPMHQQFVEPSKRYADIVVLEGGHNLVALDMIIQRIRSHVAG